MRGGLRNRPDDPDRAKKKLGKPRLNWITEVTKEADQVAAAMPDQPPLEELLLDRKKWAAALCDHVKTPRKRIGQVRHHCMMLQSRMHPAPDFRGNRFLKASKNLYKMMSAGIRRGLRGNAISEGPD